MKKRFLFLFVVTFLFYNPLQSKAQDGKDKGCSPTVANPCTNGPSGSGGTKGPSIWDIMRTNRENKKEEERQKRIERATEANKRGIAAWNNYDYETAVKEFTLAHELNPDNTTIADNLAKAKQALQEQRESRARSDAEETKRKQIAGDAANKMSASMQSIADSLSTAPATSGLEFGDPSVVDLSDKKSLTPDMISGTATFSSPDSYTPNDRNAMLYAMAALTEKLGWTLDEAKRMMDALQSLELEGASEPNQIMQYVVWQRMGKREEDNDLIAAANAAGGKGMPGAGTQSTNDCTLFALANAAGLPYGVVAARATKLIREGEWRKPSERESPESVFNKGLNGYEVVMLAEAFGQVEVVKSSSFIDVLKERPIMVGVNLATKDKDGQFKSYRHEVVLTKSFQYKGETYFEVMDSNQPPTVRHYLTKKELDQIIFENGVAFRPEEDTVVKSIK